MGLVIQSALSVSHLALGLYGTDGHADAALPHVLYTASLKLKVKAEGHSVMSLVGGYSTTRHTCRGARSHEYIALVGFVLTSLRVNDRSLKSDGEKVDADT